MERTIEEYLNNPMGEGSAALSSRELVYNDLVKRYMALDGKLDMTPIVFKDTHGNYFFHVVVPSESDRGNTYDVIIKFESSKEVENDRNLKNYKVRFFSNSPAFVYTYAYVYNKSKLLVDELKDKYDTEVLMNPPKKRNPQQTFGYEKSLFFAAYSIVHDNKYLNKLIIDPISKNYTKKKLEDLIRNDEKIKQQINREQRRIKNATEMQEKDLKREYVNHKRNIINNSIEKKNKLKASKSSLSNEQSIRRKTKTAPKKKIGARK